MRKTISSREDISTLVHAFYGKIRSHETLGPIFNSHITDTDWPIHLNKLTDFWETNIFGIPKFKGNPTQKHIQVDKNLHHKVSFNHFEQWLALWTETLDEMFEGENAIKAKNRAKNMAVGQYTTLLNFRNN